MNAATSKEALANPAIQVRDVSYRYAHAALDALSGVSLDIPRGAIFGLLGPNGAGKSTLLALISGSLHLQSGSIAVIGEPLPQRARAIKRISAIVPQEYAFYESLSGRRNLDYFGRVFGLSRDMLQRRAAHAIDVCRLAEHIDQPAGTYSGGLKRRLNLAIGLLNEPQILYLDEPTVGIDAQSRRYILDAVQALKSQGTTIVYTSHYMEEVEQLCDAVAVIDHGRVVLQDRMEHLLLREGNEAMQLTLAQPAPALAPLLTPFAATHLDFTRWTLTVPRERLQDVIALIDRTGVRIDKMQYGISRLEKIYLDLLLTGAPAVEVAS